MISHECSNWQKCQILEYQSGSKEHQQTLTKKKDHIVLVEVFKVNCPGCFMHALPEAIEIYNKYKDDGVRVIGIATAFEDFDKNTLDNLKMLAETGGDSRRNKKCIPNEWTTTRRKQTTIQDSISFGNG